MERAEGRGAVPGAHRADVVPPTPARAAMGPAPASTHAEPGAAQSAERAAAPPTEASLEVEGVRWSVRVLGRSGSPKAPLLLLGFFRSSESPEPTREALVMTRALQDLTELQLEAAWRAGVAPMPAGTRRPFFPEIAARGTKEG